MHALTLDLASLVFAAQEQVPEDDDVVAGWTGLAVFAFLLVAVALIGWSLVRQLRKAERAKAEGVYGDDPAALYPPEEDETPLYVAEEGL